MSALESLQLSFRLPSRQHADGVAECSPDEEAWMPPSEAVQPSGFSFNGSSEHSCQEDQGGHL